MPSLFSRILSVPDEPRNAWSVIKWWEKRRWLYSPVVLTVSVLSYASLYEAYLEYCYRTGALQEDGLFWIFCGIDGVAITLFANVGYTCGWLVELVLRRTLRDRPIRFAPVAFLSGLAASILLVIGLSVWQAIRLATATKPFD